MSVVSVSRAVGRSVIADLIRGLARFENLADDVRMTEELLAEPLRPADIEPLIAERGSQLD